MQNDQFGGRAGDFVTFCDICGTKCWASETVVLDVYTGRGGLRVCKEDIDPIDYGLVPYKVPAEIPTPFSRDTVQDADPMALWNGAQFFPFDYSIFDPAGTPPGYNSLLYQNWDQASLLTWDQMTLVNWDQWGINGDNI